MATKITRNKKQFQEFSVITNTLSKQWSADQFALAFLGKENLEKLNIGEILKFKSFQIWKNNGSMFMRHKERDGKAGSQIEVTSKNAERLYFAACVENHLLSEWPHITYEQPDGDGGRVDVVVWSGPQNKGGKVLAIYENKQAGLDNTDFPLVKQREDAIGQAISRIERFYEVKEPTPNDKSAEPILKTALLGKTVALTVCLFDKTKLNLSSAGEYYNNHAKTLNGREDRLALAERSIETSGMWTESWIVDVEELLGKRPDHRKGWLTSRLESCTSAPMIPLAAKKSSRVSTAGLDESIAKNRVIYSKMSEMMNYPFLNPAGFSDAQNTRDLTESKARKLTASISASILSNISAWKNAGGSQSRGMIDETFFTLGSNDRELHLVKSSCFEAEDAHGSYERIWMCADVGFANGQHSTLAFQMIRDALADADFNSAESLKESFLKANAFTGLGFDDYATKEMKAELNILLDTPITNPNELLYFFNNVIVQTSLKWARDDLHSSRLSFDSNNSVEQNKEDLLIHQNRDQIKHALAALSAECARQKRPNPLVMAKNHQSTMTEAMSRVDGLVQLQDATQWLTADSMFRNKKWGPLENEWREVDPKLKNFPANKTIASTKIQETFRNASQPISSAQADMLGADILCYQNVYRSIFASTKIERLKTYGDIKKTLMAGDDLSTVILDELKELKDDFKHKDLATATLEFSDYYASLTKNLENGVNKGWIETKTSSRISLVIEEAIERFKLGKMSHEKILDILTNESLDAVEQINENGSTPSALHAAAICAKSMEEFKAETCKRATAEHAGIPKEKGKTQKVFSKFSEILSLDKYAFWSKEASFDMLVAASLARAHGSVLSHGEYKIEPENLSGNAWSERLAERVKTAAAVSLQKIEIMTRNANKHEGALVSHYFRHSYGAFRLVGYDGGAKLVSNALKEAGVPTELLGFNFYEWMMNCGLPSKPGSICTKNALPVIFLDETIRSNSKNSAAPPTIAKKIKSR